MPRIHALLVQQRIAHDVFVIEQACREQPFNRGKLFNVGVTQTTDHDYFCFHDVDMLPESERCDYSYASAPTHLSAYCSQFEYKLPYQGIFGGVTLFNLRDFISVNGFSNGYWGWGGEDDDLRVRCEQRGLTVRRRLGRYTSLPHRPQCKDGPHYQRNLTRLEHMRDCRLDAAQDGYSTLENFDIIERVRGPGHIRVLVDFDRSPL